MRDREIVVGVTGASGGLLARRFVEVALESRGLRRLHLVFSDAALEVARNEVNRKITSGEDWMARLKDSRAPLRVGSTATAR
jgi:3-polyprenyl-4-hydroxybenzoate decarboxylase